MADEQLNVGLLMMIAYRSMENRVFAALAASGYGDLTVAQGRIVAQIGAEGTRLTELAERAQVTKQTAGFLVDQLERAGYVERVADPSDGRARLVRLTARGIAGATYANSVAEQVQTEWAEELGAASMRQLRRTMTRLRAITDPYA
ncbi:putative MarR family transcriptional regulator [Nocardia brasiliensis NBRC 14402]|uniref:MarR family winged helix-turn-helix transcriptional regulator n=1 Tax=Nocardia brasiliensis TaxID=37326 RepID=UPI0002E28AC9|nr:MarR family transcriptional regulator [Nocardia brasiliensis]ASF07259.1 transcriptional regulator [Nocardia brasiliensis]GAJ79483.1 putative MarR family transcriptional regulator [Nocardia brasiliensis NBRC 14402]SUB47454.1 homoprotocatechuate degradation operon regulator, HpaR [Nocardia brasiliensis]